ncbi:MAG: pentapeptide repeat-containing protein [Cytophagales bacterium]|nr:pentapeptide repeat-containing protein [Cytophagales bacterium]
MVTIYNIYGNKLYSSSGTREQVFLEAIRNKVDLTGVDCENLNLTNQRIEGAKLFMAKMRGGNFEGTEWIDCDLRQVDFQKSICSHGKFVGCNLEALFFCNSKANNLTVENCSVHLLQARGCNLQNSTWAQLRHANFIDFSFSNLTKSDLAGALLLDPDFGHSNIDQLKMPAQIERGYFAHLESATSVDWEGGVVRQSQFNGASFQELKGRGLVFSGCEGTDLAISNSVIEGASIEGRFIGFKLVSTNAVRCGFEGTFEQSQFIQSDISKAHSTGASFIGSHFESTMTDGANLPMSRLQGSIHKNTRWDKANLNMSEIHRTEFHDSPVNTENQFITKPINEAIDLTTKHSITVPR